MYAVIFTAKIKEIDTPEFNEYLATAKKMRALATEKYGCVDFKSALEDGEEIAISYWPSLKCIEKWKSDPEHIKAQALGQQKWYSGYNVQVVKIEREYGQHT